MGGMGNPAHMLGLLFHLLLFAAGAAGVVVCTRALLALDAQFEELPEPQPAAAEAPSSLPAGVDALTA
jgi:hypothetical protein